MQIDEDELIRRSVEGLKQMEPIPKARIVTHTASIHIDSPGVTYVERCVRAMDMQDSYSSLPNVLAMIGEHIKEQTLTEK